MDGNNHRVWTKGIPKTVRTLAKIDAYWDAIHEKWEEHTPTQAKMTGKQIFVALPNDITEAEIQKVAKSILKTVPQHHPATMAVHYTSGKDDTKNVHLHGVISMRRGGYGKTNDEYRLNARELAKQAVDQTLKKCGYSIEQNSKVVKTRPPRFAVRNLLRKYTDVQLKSPEFLRCFVLPYESGRTKRWLQEEIAKVEAQRFEGIHRFSQDSAPFWNFRAVVEPAFKKAGLPPSAYQILKQKVIAQTPSNHGARLNYTEYLKQVAPPKQEKRFNYLKQRVKNRISILPATDNTIKAHEICKWGDVSAETAGGKYRELGFKPTDFSQQLSKIAKAVIRKGTSK